MNSNPVNKNYVQAGLEAHEKIDEYMKRPAMDPGGYGEVWTDENRRALHLLHHDGECGHSTFRAGDTLIGPVEDQSLTRMMEKKISGGE